MKRVNVVSDRWAVGSAYEAYMGRWSRPLARVFVDWLAAETRAHWLDVGCGTGALTEAICELGKPASVIACDPSGPFLETVSSTLPDKRVNVELGDGDHLPAREGGFDVIVSGLVLNFLPDAARSLSAMRDRLSPNGLVGAYVWDYAGGVQFLRHFWDAAVALDPDAAPLHESRRFATWQPEQLADAFRSAGLVQVQVERFTLSTAFASFDDFWQPFLGRTGAAPSYVASLEPGLRERLRERLREQVPADASGRISLEASAWGVRGQPAV